MKNKILKILLKKKQDRTLLESVNLFLFWNSNMSIQELKFALQIDNLINN